MMPKHHYERKGMTLRKLAVTFLVALFLAPGTANAFPKWQEYKDKHPVQVYMHPVKGVHLWESLRTRRLWSLTIKRKTAKAYHKWKDEYASWLASLAPSLSTQSPSSGSYGKYDGDHLSLWLCIHSHEGAWDDPNPPYFGGLQMGYGFMEAYGGSLYADKGTADHWTVDEQIGVAENAWAKNGYHLGWLYSQWP